MPAIDRRKFLSGASTVILAATFPVGAESYLRRIVREWGGGDLDWRLEVGERYNGLSYSAWHRHFELMQHAFDVPGMRFSLPEYAPGPPLHFQLGTSSGPVDLINENERKRWPS